MYEWYLIFCVMLICAGYQDIKKRMVSDRLTAGMWVVGFCYCYFVNPLYAVPFCAFAFVYMYNALAYLVNPKLGFGWADILTLPIYFLFLYSFGLYFVIFGFLLANFLSIGYLLYYKKGAAYVAFLAVSYAVCLALFLCL